MRLVSSHRTELLLFTYYTLLLGPSPVCSIEESMCIGVGYTKLSERTSPGLTSMGATSFFQIPINNIWAAYHVTQEYKQGPHLILRLIMAKAADGTKKILNGWFHIIVKQEGPSKIHALAVWAITDQKETFGQFVPFGPKKCGNWTEPANCIPCSATPVDSPLNPSMFLVTTTKPEKEFHLFWKGDTSSCNKPDRITFMVVINPNTWNSFSSVAPFEPKDGKTKNVGPTVFRSSWVYFRFYGAASPVFEIDTLTENCKLDEYKANDYPTDWLPQKPVTSFDHWGVLTNLDGTDKDKFIEDREMDEPAKSADSPLAIYRQVCKGAPDGFVDFGGRCEAKVSGATARVYASDNNPPRCDFASNNFDQRDLSRLKGPLQDFVDGARTGEVTIGCDCPPVPDKSEVISIAARGYLNWVEPNPYNSEELGCRKGVTEGSFDYLGLCKYSVAGKATTHLRVWHSGALLLCNMVLIPISIFAARYLKGHIYSIRKKPRLQTRPWYMIHVFMPLAMSCMYLTSLSSIHGQRHVLGFSFSPFADFHRTAGFVMMGLFQIGCLSGPFRPINIHMRRVAIFLHCLLGYFIHYGSVVLSVLTYRIPSSPLSFVDHLEEDKFRNPFRHYGSVAIIVWVVVDLALNILLSAQVMWYVRKQFRANICHCFPIFLPMHVDTGQKADAKENKFLWNTFYFYISFCLVFYVFVQIIILHFNTEQVQGFGPMHCTHNEDGGFFAGNSNLSQPKFNKKTNYCNKKV